MVDGNEVDGNEVDGNEPLRLYPAIDLRGGRCVRLLRGDYDRETTYGDDPAAQAEAFTADGATWLHVVDLDAARTGQPTNRAAIGAIVDAVDVPVEVGGGVRDRRAAEALFDIGVTRAVIGTAALERPELVGELVGAGRRVAVGIDARGDEVATHGWTERTGHTIVDVADRFSDLGVDALIVTEIGRDGTMEGPDTAGLAGLLASTTTPVIASGGVGSLADLASLATLRAGGRSLHGAIVGRALYEGEFTVKDAIAALAAPASASGEMGR
jgi:phosphoribosylformimino-5-aminoimidazole carboxamide ribotide isomerase